MVRKGALHLLRQPSGMASQLVNLAAQIVLNALKPRADAVPKLLERVMALVLHPVANRVRRSPRPWALCGLTFRKAF